MKKVWIAQIVFLVMMVGGMFLLNLEAGGDINLFKLRIYAMIALTGLSGNIVCALYRVFASRQDKEL